MSMDATTFANRSLHILETFPKYANASAEISAIVTALGGDTTTHDTTIRTAPAGVRPGHPINTPFTNALVHEVNKGKAGNLPNATMATILQAATGPVNTSAPAISYASGGGGAGNIGSTYARTTGGWQPPGATITQQWLRNGANIAGATATSYTLVAADQGTNLSCRVTATNSRGSNSMPSNSIAIPAP